MTDAPPKKRPTVVVETAPPAPREEKPKEKGPPVPILLDFFPLEDPKQTQIAAFFTSLRAGRLTTTRCAKDGILWPPRVACPVCHATELAWVDLPLRGHVYAFSAVLAGAPLGMESDLPFVVGLVDLEGAGLRLFGRITGRPWTDCRIGMPVTVEPFDVGDGRVFYRFRASS